MPNKRQGAKTNGHEQDEQLRLILDNVADLIAILDKDGKRIFRWFFRMIK